VSTAPTRRHFLIGASAVPGALAASGYLPGRLIERIDCVRDYGPERYFAGGPTRIVASPAGRYREAAPVPQARFGYRFRIEHPGRPHLALIRYPDDKRRYMCVMDGTSYDLSTGVFTGVAQPLSGAMLAIQLVFWPRWQDASITFLTWGKGEPAAVESVEIYELAGLAPLAPPAAPDPSPRRELGIQYEDPCGTGASEGALSRDQWLDRLVAYARHSGQSLLVYPIAWYHGPLFPSTREPADGFDMVVAPDRRQYARWTTHPADWYARLLERFGREGLHYQASLTLLRLGSLMRRMASEPICNMLWNNRRQEGTQDWTPLYNARNYAQVLEYYARGESLRNFPWAYGEKSGQPYHPGPIFNPLHPVVEEAVLGFAAEIASRYARYPAFRGIQFNMWHATILWYGSLDAGYDDYTVGLFEQETGIAVPAGKSAPDRFALRHHFLTRVCRPAWVDWWCGKLRDLYRRIRDRVLEARPDLRVTFTLWTEMTIPALLGPIGASHQLYARPATVDLWREAGFDPDLLAGEPGIEVDLQLEPQRDRSGWGAAGAGTPIEQTGMFRDHDFLDAPTLAALRRLPRSGAFVFNSWVEAWGRHRWFAPQPGDTQARELAFMDGQPAGGIFRINSEYPPDGFWWDSQLRITAALPSGVHFMEHYAHAVAEFDACRITRGGLYLDKAHGAEIRAFARAYRALPRRKFETVGRTTDPVAVRTLVCQGTRYLYAVNRDYYPVKVTLDFDRDPGRVIDLASAAGLEDPRAILLGPYQLRSFQLSPAARPTGFSVRVPDPIAAGLLAQARQALRNLRRPGKLIAGSERMAREIETALAERRFAWLRRALASYIVRAARPVHNSG